MKNRLLFRLVTAIIVTVFTSNIASAQSTGYINRPATVSAGRTILDPNGDGYTSATTAGYAGDDVTNSELPYRSVPSFSTEPFGDLRRGPSHLYSDFVPDGNNVGYYTYFDGTNLLFRFRMGSVMPGSKGYSVLLDTDGKFGATGTNADPNYVAATTGTNGNPGFEIEIVLETNFRIAIYNVDGSSTATLIKAYTNWQDMSQISVAGTFDNGDPDFFIDFYIPFSDLQASPFNLTTSTSIRMSATTVMSPQAAIGGPKSDIYGLNDAGYKSTNDQYEAYVNAQPSFTATSLTTTEIGAMCTAPPVVTSPIGTGTVTVSGSWTKSSLSGATEPATITVYKNGVSIGTVANISSGGSWSLTGVTLVNGDVITAKAQASGESMCLVSNSVTASTCNSSNRPSTPLLNCYTTSKGIQGTNLSTGWRVHVDNLTRSTTDNNVTNSTGLFAAPTGSSPNLSWTYSGDCSTGSPLTSGSYKVYYTSITTGCVSEPAYVCVAGTGGNALAGSLAAPVITTPSNGVFTPAVDTITGTTDANANVYLYINGTNVQSTVATGGNFTFPNLTLITGQTLYIVAELNTGSVSTSKCAGRTSLATVVCFTSAPLINVDNNNQIAVGAAITGTSGSPVGTTIRVYATSNTSTPVATVTVQSNGTWTTGSYLAAASTSYYATAQDGSCGVSSASANATAVSATTGRCGSITSPVTTTDMSISGGLTASATQAATVNLYLDGQKVGSTSVAINTSTWSIATSSLTNPIYNNGVLTIGIQESGKQEQMCAAAVTVSCSTGPAQPVFTPSSTSITSGQSQTYTISNAQIGSFYGIANASTGQAVGSGVWATSSTVNLSTYSSLSSGPYDIAIKGTSLTGVSVCSSSPGTASLLVSSILPLSLTDFKGSWKNATIVLNWNTENESLVSHFDIEKSIDGLNSRKIGEKRAANQIQNSYSYIDEQPTSTNYYRLKMFDIDGRFTYSKVVVLSKQAILSSSIQPNPFSNSITANIELSSAQQVKTQMIDINGRVVRSQSFKGQVGLNSMQITELHGLNPGVYLINIMVDNKIVLQEKLVKGGR